MAKVMCGLWGCHVELSRHNDKCPCVNCFGTHCQMCKTYEKYSLESDCIRERVECNLCKAYWTQIR